MGTHGHIPSSKTLSRASHVACTAGRTRDEGRSREHGEPGEQGRGGPQPGRGFAELPEGHSEMKTRSLT